MKEVTDKMLIQRVLSGDGMAFGALVDRHKSLVFNIIRRIVRQPEDAEELAQDVFLKVYQALPRFKQESQFSTWLYRVAYNTAISYTRKNRPEVNLLDERTAETWSNMPDEETDRQEQEQSLDLQRERMKNAVEKMNEEDKLLLNLFYYNDLSINEISGILGIKENAVKVRLFRLRNKIKNG